MVMREKLDEIWPKEKSPVDAFLFEQGAVMRAAKAVFQRRTGITEARLHVMGILFINGEISQAELQRQLNIDGAAVTRQVKQMEAEGLLTRRADPADNRFTLVTLTTEGADKLHEVAREFRAHVARCLNGISDEDMVCIQRVMKQIRTNIENMQ